MAELGFQLEPAGLQRLTFVMVHTTWPCGCVLLTNGSIRKSQEIYTLKAYWFKVILLIILQSNNVFCNVNNWLLTYLLCKLSFFIEYFFLMGRKPELKFRDKLTFKVKSKWFSVLPYYFKINLFWDNVFKLCSL